jgi:adenine-specific DNA-methyltransferase
MIENITQYIYNSIKNYTKKSCDNKRKDIGQYFTPVNVAQRMAAYFTPECDKIYILDPGAGAGILTGALCDHIVKYDNVTNIYVDLYENDIDILEILKLNMDAISDKVKKQGKKFYYKIINRNFIFDNASNWQEDLFSTSPKYDVVILNPPYKKLSKSCAESKIMEDIVFGQPNIYYLFMAMSAKLLKENGQFISITPRSFCTGEYFKLFRKWFLKYMKINKIHVYNSRKKTFENEVLQETIILKAIKTDKKPRYVDITSDNTTLNVAYEKLVDFKDNQLFIKIPLNNEDEQIIDLINSWNSNLIKNGYKLSTGPVVDFRATEYIIHNEVNNIDVVPLFWPCNITNNYVVYSGQNDKRPNFIKREAGSLLVKNENYIFLKRFTSKEQKKRLQCGIYFKEQYPFDKIGIENHLNYIKKIEGSMTRTEIYGIFTFLNSNYIERYFRILNGNTQVNANEINFMPLPDNSAIIGIGNKILNHDFISPEVCDDVINEYFNLKLTKAV